MIVLCFKTSVASELFKTPPATNFFTLTFFFGTKISSGVHLAKNKLLAAVNK